jgi:nitric oxide reductase subunit C
MRSFTSQMARNIFYGGTVFFVLLFVVIIFDTENRIPERSNSAEITPAVVRGKHLWETRN